MLFRYLGVALLFAFGTGVAQAASVASCIPAWQATAQKQGLSARTINTVIPALKLVPRVLELDHSQPEFTTTFSHYLSRRLTAQRVEQGRKLLQKHAALLSRLTDQYMVPGRYLVAFWGLETNYGGYMGDMPTLDALATLACDERRSEYFTQELMSALALSEREHIDPPMMKGSWAGAVGQTQFMPSNYQRYGVDGDGDGRVDLWNSIPDALTSAANFLQQLGWVADMRWGREVRLPKGFDYALAGLNRPLPLRRWAQLGVQRAWGGTLPVADVEAALLVPAGHKGPAFLVYKNFRVIMRWNHSTAYALSVALLADRLIGAGQLANPPPADEPRLSHAQVIALQTKLNQLGFKAGEPDGIIGPATRSAIRAFQQQRGMIADGFHSAQVLAALGVAYE